VVEVVERAVQLQPARDRDGEGPAEVAVADAGRLQPAPRARRAQRLDRQQRGDRGECFDRRGDLRRGERVQSLPARRVDAHEAGFDQPAQVWARGRRRHAGGLGEFSRGVAATVHQAQQHGRPGPVGDGAGDGGEVALHPGDASARTVQSPLNISWPIMRS
jgi:hypothetical protein